MNIRRTVFAASIALVASLGSANAQGYNWAGLYGGFNVGGITTPGGQTTASTVGATGAPIGSAAYAALTAQNLTGATVDQSVPMAGVQIGYNWRINQAFVAGLEADISAAYQDSNTIFRTQPFTGFPGFTVNARVTADSSIEYFGTVRARAGYVVTAPLLVYVTAGLAYAQTNTSTQYTVTAPGTGLVPPVGTFGGRSMRAGYTAGGGFEYALTRNVSLKAEGLYYDLGSVTDQTTFTSISGGNFISTTAVARTTNFNGAIGRLGLNYLF